MKYSISIDELIQRPIISDNAWLEFLNKMTDEENFYYLPGAFSR